MMIQVHEEEWRWKRERERTVFGGCTRRKEGGEGFCLFFSPHFFFVWPSSSFLVTSWWWITSCVLQWEREIKKEKNRKMSRERSKTGSMKDRTKQPSTPTHRGGEKKNEREGKRLHAWCVQPPGPKKFSLSLVLFLRYVIYNMWAIQSCRALYICMLYIYSTRRNPMKFRLCVLFPPSPPLFLLLLLLKPVAYSFYPFPFCLFFCFDFFPPQQFLWFCLFVDN